jgi:hypothetical protein
VLSSHSFPLLLSFISSVFTGLIAQKGVFFLESSCLTLLSSSICKTPRSIFCSAGLAITNSFSFFFLWKVLFSPSITKVSFAGFTSLG